MIQESIICNTSLFCVSLGALYGPLVHMVLALVHHAVVNASEDANNLKPLHPAQ
jgi:hypothetical protein